jgi:hypothetical protein
MVKNDKKEKKLNTMVSRKIKWKNTAHPVDKMANWCIGGYYVTLAKTRNLCTSGCWFTLALYSKLFSILKIATNKFKGGGFYI